MTTNPNPQLGPVDIGPGDALLTDELLAARHRIATSRARGAHALTRSQARRRILPSIVVTSMALVGAGLADAFVNSTIVATTSTTPSNASAVAAIQNSANTLTLTRLTSVIAADQRTLATLAASAARTSAAAASGSGTSTSSSSGSNTALVSVAAPVAATPAPAPAPATHATTGASSVP